MSFALPNFTAVKLLHLNIRGEKHGPDTVDAIDLKFKLDISNEALALFHPQLREALYFNADADQGQEQINEVPAILPNRRFPSLQPVKWDLELAGQKVVIDYGLGEERGSNVELHDCKVNGFVLDPKEGGTVEVTFRVQNSHVPDGALDKLRKKLEQETAITIVAGEPKAEAIDGTVGHPGAKAAAQAEAAGQQRIEDAAEGAADETGERNDATGQIAQAMMKADAKAKAKKIDAAAKKKAGSKRQGVPA